MILCYLGTFSEFSGMNTFSDIRVGGVPQRAVLPHFPLRVAYYVNAVNKLSLRDTISENDIPSHGEDI